MEKIEVKEELRKRIAEICIAPGIWGCEHGCSHWWVKCGGFTKGPCKLQYEQADKILAILGIK